MKTAAEILNQAEAMGFRLSRHGDKVRLHASAGCSPPPDLDRAIRDHKQEILDYLASRETITREEYEALTPEQKEFWQPATGRKQSLSWEESGRLLDHYHGNQTPFEEEADTLLFESTRRIASAWPAGFDLDANPRWQKADLELHHAYHSGDPEKLRVILELREKLAMKLFEVHRKGTAA